MLEIAFHVAATPVSWLELAAFACAIVGVVFTMRVSAWGWPPTLLASALYGWLFFEHRLYGDAALQIFFIAVSVWGWRAWLRPVLPAAPAQGVRSLSRGASIRLVAALAATWLAIGLLLARFTDTDVPWFDAAPTAGSVFAQVLLVRKQVEAWVIWMGVNAIAVALFATQSLWLTAILYSILFMLSLGGWRHWRRLASTV